MCIRDRLVAGRPGPAAAGLAPDGERAGTRALRSQPAAGLRHRPAVRPGGRGRVPARPRLTAPDPALSVFQIPIARRATGRHTRIMARRGIHPVYARCTLRARLSQPKPQHFPENPHPPGPRCTPRNARSRCAARGQRFGRNNPFPRRLSQPIDTENPMLDRLAILSLIHI